MSTIISDNSADDIFTDYSDTDIPSEYNPFCNSTENSSFNENYSHILPAFFFRTQKCRKKPSEYEKKNLRYFYNTTGIILTSKLIIEVLACLIFFLVTFLCTYSLTSSTSMYYSVLSDSTVRYAFKTITLIISTISVFFAGCRFSAISPLKLVKKCKTLKTADVIIFFMAGLFAASLQNVAVFFRDDSMTNIFEKDITQIVMAAVYSCLIVPVSEGLIFRGIALKNLSRASQRFGILASSLLCALSSCSFYSVIPVFLMSVLLSELTVKYNTVTPSIFIHISVNICGAFISAYSALLWDSDIFVTKIWTVIALVTGGIFTLILVVKNPLPKSVPEQRRRSFPLFVSSVFILILIPLYIAATAADFLSYIRI